MFCQHPRDATTTMGPGRDRSDNHKNSKFTTILGSTTQHYYQQQFPLSSFGGTESAHGRKKSSEMEFLTATGAPALNSLDAIASLVYMEPRRNIISEGPAARLSHSLRRKNEGWICVWPDRITGKRNGAWAILRSIGDESAIAFFLCVAWLRVYLGKRCKMEKWRM